MATLLVIDDSPAQRGVIRAAVEAAGIFSRILEAQDGLEGLKALLGESVDVVLCDLDVQGLEGDKLLRLKASGSALANLPFVFLTGEGALERKVRVLEDGACDAIAKPFHPADLVARLRLHLKVKRLQDELLVKNARLAELSTVDPLTRLRTRRYAQEFLAVEFLRSRRYGNPLAVCMADLDHFKAINDEHGHAGGDAVLRTVGGLLAASVRATDVAGRYGGEEFVIVMPQAPTSGMAIWGDRFRVKVAETSVDVGGGRQVRATVSGGIAAYHPDMTSPEDLLAAADTALYAAKERGRNRFVIAGD